MHLLPPLHSYTPLSVPLTPNGFYRRLGVSEFLAYSTNPTTSACPSPNADNGFLHFHSENMPAAAVKYLVTSVSARSKSCYIEQIPQEQGKIFVIDNIAKSFHVDIFEGLQLFHPRLIYTTPEGWLSCH
ncbi:hypothetical protein PISMIDRAFT_683717 [Pisolithus microcarpus 441]|uniref:Uncharacterized protein n=1 Tax=Pisolithus microcarpus 441 TaxID=765257 RepID=A0A0C9ZG07_9AGAM|nr:hypothetical protein PISMIDRAFT_683717 [Pisolithus microcarpus 441]